MSDTTSSQSQQYANVGCFFGHSSFDTGRRGESCAVDEVEVEVEKDFGSTLCVSSSGIMSDVISEIMNDVMNRMNDSMRGIMSDVMSDSMNNVMSGIMTGIMSNVVSDVISDVMIQVRVGRGRRT